MHMRSGVAVALFALLVSGTRMAAHHSAAAEYDESKTVTVTGKVSAVEWENPHVRFTVDAAGPGNQVTSWTFELASPNSLTRAGWGRRTVKVGDVLTVTGSPARSGKPLGVTKSVRTPDGKKLFTGTMGIEDK